MNATVNRTILGLMFRPPDGSSLSSLPAELNRYLLSKVCPDLGNDCGIDGQPYRHMGCFLSAVQLSSWYRAIPGQPNRAIVFHVVSNGGRDLRAFTYRRLVH
jgi:hypothetical protein